MSAEETTGGGAPPEESGRSSISFKRNPSSGNVEVAVKVYATANDEVSVGEANGLAVRLFRDNCTLYPMQAKR